MGGKWRRPVALSYICLIDISKRSKRMALNMHLCILYKIWGGAAAVSYILLTDISKISERIILNMHLHSMQNMGGVYAVVYVFERYKPKTYSLEYTFYAKYASM